MEKIMTIGNVVILLINMIYIHLLLSRVKSIKYCITTLVITNIIIYFCAEITYALLGDTKLFRLVFYFLAFLNIIYIKLVFKESFSKKLFTMFSVWTFSLITLFVSTFIANSLFSRNFTISKIVMILMKCCIQVGFVPILHFYFRKPYKNMLNIVSNKIIDIMSSYLVVGFIVLVINYDYNSIYFTSVNILLEKTLFLLFVVLGYFMVIIAILSVSKNVSLQAEYKVIENQVEFQRENYKILNEAIQNMYALRHDTRHHISFIKTMIEEKNYDKALEYIQQFNQNEMDKNIPALCENFTADSIIKYYMSIALKKEIEFKTKLIIPEKININNIDLCVVLGNCLENAIDACDRMTENRKKYIYFQSKIIGSHIVFKITNSFTGKIVSFNNSLISIKEKQGHGIGIANVQKTVNKYKGNFDFNYSEDEFNVDIVMNIKSVQCDK